MLDSVSYLASYGWQGQGNGLREGSLSRPLAIPQKRTLAGLGKDRDEAFPFWDHLFAAAAKTIKIKVSDEDDGEAVDDSMASTGESVLLRTKTGILSNRRPILGTPASSGSATPSDSDSQPSLRLSLLATVKRDNARKTLYARFFKGPVLGPEVEVDPPLVVHTQAGLASDATTHELQVGFTNITSDDLDHGGESPSKKRKHDGQDHTTKTKKPKKMKIGDAGTEVTSVKEQKKEGWKGSEEEVRSKGKNEDIAQVKRKESVEEKRQRKADKAERRKRKEERRRAKEDRRRTREERRKAKGKTKNSS